MRRLNHLYQETPALWEEDFSWEGFQWIVPDDSSQNVVVFLRRDKKRRRGHRGVQLCARAAPRTINSACPRAGQYAELINSDAEEFGGTGQHNAPVRAKKQPMHGFDYSISLRVPPMSAVILRTPAAKPAKSGRAGAEKSRRPWRKGEARKKNRGAQNHRQTGEGRIGVPALFPARPARRGSQHKIGRRVPGAGKGRKT